MKTNKTTKFKSWELRDTIVDTESVLTCLYIANFIPVLKIEKIRAVFEFIKNLEKKFIVNKSQATSTRMRIFLNPQLVLSGLKNFHVHTYPYWNRICPSTRILICSSTQDSSENIGNRACVVVAVLNTVLVSLRNRTAERRGRQIACAWRTWQGYNLRVLSWSWLTSMFSGLLQKDLFKRKWSLAKSYFKQNYCHACHTRFAVFFPLPSCCVSSLFMVKN